MFSRDTLAVRIEWEGRGPFWCEKTRRLLERLCRKETPDWKMSEEASTFVQHYITHAPSPYDEPAFEWHLSRMKDADTSLSFGFTGKDSLIEQFGLDLSRYKRQFQALFNRPEFAVRAYLVQSLAQSDSEVLYRRANAELVEECKSWNQFFNL